MRKSTISIVKDLNSQLIKIHDLANLLEKKDSEGVVNFRGWLLETETFLKKYDLPQVSQLATIRTQLANYLPKGNKSKRKEFYNYTANLLTQAQESVWQTNSNYQEKAEKATELINQLLHLIYQANAFHFDNTQDFTVFLENIWVFCSTHEQLKGITIQILSFISKSDVLLVLAENIDLRKLQ